MIFSEVLPSGFPDVPSIHTIASKSQPVVCQSLELFAREVLPEFDAREEARAQRPQEELAPVIEQAIMRKEKVAPLAEDKIPSYVALGRQVANGPQLTPEQEAARRRMLASAQVPLENQRRNRLRLAALFSTCCAVASICQRLDVDWNYQLAGSLLRPRRTNVCRQSG
jgi:hypothetical protein